MTEVKKECPECPDWVIFHFLAEYDSGNFIKTKEGDLLELKESELLKKNMLPSFRYILNHILSNKNKILFTTFYYSNKVFIDNSKKIFFA